jgi:serine/threonine protein kinase HipA of HipAB toxin-antitoxin module
MGMEADMAELVMFPGVRREPLPTPDQEPETPVEGLTSLTVLQAAIENEIEDVVVVGLKSDGSIYVSALSGDDDAVAGKLLRAANYMASVEYEYEDEYE